MLIKSILTPQNQINVEIQFSKQKLMFPLAISQETTVIMHINKI